MATTVPTERGAPVGTDADRGVAVLVALLVALVPLAAGRVLWSVAFAPGAQVDANRWVAVGPADIASLAIVVVWVRTVLPGGLRRPSSLLGWCAAAVLALEVLALAVHPSPRGVDLIARLLAAAATADLVRRLRSGPALDLVLGAVVAVCGFESLLAMVQSWRGAPFGLQPLDLPGRLYTFGASSAGRGGFTHPYHLSSLLALGVGAAVVGLHRAERRWPWAVGLGLCAAGMTVTFSRTGAIGMLAVLAVTGLAWVTSRRPAHLLALVAMLLGLAFGGLAFGSGWVSRSSTTVDAQTVDSGRRDRAAEAARLIRTEPLTGVGPGRYVLALQHVEYVELRPAHDLPLHVSAEAGLLCGAAATAALLLLGRRCVQRGTLVLSVFLPVLPFLLLDAFPYTWPQGIALSGIWLGLLTRDSF